MTEILKTLLTMTPAWLEEALTEAGHSPPPVKSVQVRPMDDFVGAMGEVGIVSVTYAGSTDLPVEFVAKCPLDDDIARMYASVMLVLPAGGGLLRRLGVAGGRPLRHDAPPMLRQPVRS